MATRSLLLLAIFTVLTGCVGQDLAQTSGESGEREEPAPNGSNTNGSSENESSTSTPTPPAPAPSGSTPSNPPSSSATVTGKWTGQWHVGSLSGSIVVTITESGSKVTGTATFADSPCFPSAALEGYRSGTSVTGKFTASGGVDLTFASTLSDNNTKMAGTFEGMAGVCTSMSGTYDAARP